MLFSFNRTFWSVQMNSLLLHLTTVGEEGFFPLQTEVDKKFTSLPVKMKMKDPLDKMGHRLYADTVLQGKIN